jgi:hypothetical protein
MNPAREISAAMPSLPIVLCTVFAKDVQELKESGVRAVVDKSDAGTRLVNVVENPSEPRVSEQFWRLTRISWQTLDQTYSLAGSGARLRAAGL